MRQDLGILDRATLVAWRGLNELGWTFACFVVVVAAHVGLTSFLTSRSAVGGITGFDLDARPGAEEGFDDVVAKFGLRIGLTIVVVLIIGRIVGARVWRRHSFYAGLAAAGYAAYALIGLAYSTRGESVEIVGDGPEIRTILQSRLVPTLIYDLIVIAAVPLAALVARRVAEKRRATPAALAD